MKTVVIILLFSFTLKTLAQQSFDGVHLLKHLNYKQKILDLTQQHKQSKANYHPPKEEKNSLQLFYAISQGAFTDTTTASYTNNQNSPATIGFFINHYIDEKYQFNSSFYFSYISPSFSDPTLENPNLTIPMEWELSGDLQSSLFASMPAVNNYLGFDLEKFSTFNIDELAVATDLQTRQQTMLYLTIGAAYNFSFWNKSSQVRFDLGKSLFTSESRPSLVTTQKYSGTKIHFFCTTNIYKNWSIFLFYKLYSLTGATDLSITRTGLGISYLL